MAERPEPDSFTLTPYERGLCVACALAWVAGLSLACFAAELGNYLRWWAVQWARDQWQSVLAAEVPEFSVTNFLNLLVFGTLSGAVLLAPQYLAHLFARGRWLSPVTLWFWTMLHATLPIVLSLSVLGIRSLFWWENFLTAASLPSAALWLLLLAISLGLFFASRRAWRWRREQKNVRAP